VLSDENCPVYVPFPHSNSSSIEAWFSLVRGTERDTPVGYRGAVGTVDYTKATNGSDMYKDGEVEDTDTGVSIFERTFKRQDKKRDSWFQFLQSARKVHHVANVNFELLPLDKRPFPLMVNAPDGMMANEIYFSIKQLKWKENISCLLSRHKLFCGFAKNAWSSKRDRPFFEAFYAMTDEDACTFDTSCSLILCDLFEKMQESAKVKKTDVKASFDYQVFSYLTSKELDCALATMPREMGKCRLPCTVVVRILGSVLLDFANQQMESFLEGLKACSDMPSSEQPVEASKQVELSKPIDVERELKSQVNRFFGFAIKGFLAKWQEKTRLGDNGNESEEECNESDAFLFVAEMKYTHNQALGNPLYLRNCYSLSLRLKNMGFLTLVAPTYFEFGPSPLSSTWKK
jgi:hypothetical protein